MSHSPRRAAVTGVLLLLGHTAGIAYPTSFSVGESGSPSCRTSSRLSATAGFQDRRSQRILVLTLRSASNPTRCSNATLRAILFTDQRSDRPFSGSVAGYYLENSYGQLKVSGDVSGPYLVDMSLPCTRNSMHRWADAADAAAAAAGVNLDAYDGKLYMLPPESTATCGPWGGTAEGDRVWMRDDQCDSKHILAHELGHIFDARHAGTPGSINSGWAVYGDASSVMGGLLLPGGLTGRGVADSATLDLWNSTAHYNAPEKIAAGWLPAHAIQTVTAAGGYKIAALARPLSRDVQVLKIGNSLFSYRRATGYDADLRSQYVDRTSVHTVGNGRATILLASLGDGESFADPAGLTVTQTRHDSVFAYVDVTITAPQMGARTRDSTAQVADADTMKGLRTVAFETSEVTAPDITVSPDRRWLIFTMLGKLFRIPIQGGTAEQLTFGQHNDSDPSISPDGKLVAFQSDRDGSEGNIFLLTLADGSIRQLTRESWADRPSWAPDGRSLVYRRLERAAWSQWNQGDPERLRRPNPPATVRRIAVTGGDPATLSGMGEIRSPFHLPDGRVAWAVVDMTPRGATTRIMVRDSTGVVTLLRTLEGVADPVVASRDAGGLYARTGDELYARSDVALDYRLVFAPLPGGPERRLATVSGGNRRSGFFGSATDQAGRSSLYLGDRGHLWEVTVPGGQRHPVAFSARVRLAIREPVLPLPWTPMGPGATAQLRTIRQPRLSPDGSRLAFVAVNRLWQQSLPRGQAQRLIGGEGTEWDPAFSPDGRELAFIRSVEDKHQIQVMDLRTGITRTVAGPPMRCGYEYLTWSRHGELIAAGSCNHEILAIDPGTLTVRLLARTSGWEPYPQLSADGKTLYFQAAFPGSRPAYYRLRLEPGGKPQALFELPAGAQDGAEIVTNERWVAAKVQKRLDIHLTELGPDGVRTPDARAIHGADGSDFDFTPDGAGLLYVAGNKLWRAPIAGGAAQEIPIRLELTAPTPPPVLLRRVRLLDFAAAGFSGETSVLVEAGRIAWMGSDHDRVLPQGALTIDAGGRFAIPGLFNMHGHGGGCEGPAAMSYGVTSVRNMGGRLERQNAFADRSDLTSDPLPRCFYSGALFDAPQGDNRDGLFVHLRDEADGRSHVRLWRERGARFLKIYDRLPWPLQRAVADEARSAGLPVVAHNSSLEEAVKGVTQGYAGFTHWERFYDDAIQLFALAGTYWDQTLGVLGAREAAFRSEPERFVTFGPARFGIIGDNALQGFQAERYRTLRVAYRRGVPLVPGTDGGPVGLSLHWELEFLAEAGIPPLDILRFATLTSARVVGADAHLGTLEVGKLADLVLLDANPLENIRNTQRIWRVFKGGWQFDPKVISP